MREGEISQIRWNTFARGLNSLFAANKIRPDELSRADNIVLVGQGAPVRRWGTATYGNTDSASVHTLLSAHYDSDGTSSLVKISNGLFRKLNTSTLNWDIVSGGSFASTQRARTTLLNDVQYVSNGVDALTKYDGLGLTRFTSISKPTGLAVARGASLVSGSTRLSYRITAINDIGETDATTSVTVDVDRRREEWNFDVTSPNSNYSVNLTWTASASATGYNIYGVDETTETFLDRVNGGTTVAYRDYGLKIPSSLITYPVANTTDAPKGDLIDNYKSAIIIAGDTSNPSRLYYSAGVDRPDDFSWGAGGGFIDISKNSDDGVIVGIKKFQNSLIIFKEKSIWRFEFTDSEIPTLQNINTELGAISQESIKNVENDLFFGGRKVGSGAGIYSLGNEPNFTDKIRTNELSARVKPELDGLLVRNYTKAEAFYVDNKFIFSFVDGSGTANNSAIVYDRERAGWTRWNDICLSHGLIYFDTTGDQTILFVDETDNRVSRLDKGYTSDKGVPIEWAFATKEEDLKDPFQVKRFKWVSINVNNAVGNNTVRVYTDSVMTDFNLSLSTNFNQTAFGAWQFGSGRFGRIKTTNLEIADILLSKHFPLHRLGETSSAKTIKFEFLGSGLSSTLTLLDLFFQYKMRSKRRVPLTDIYQI